MKRVHIYYSGDVQGVGFRFTALDVARKCGIYGWVKNCADGRVELIAEAGESILKQFLSDLEKAMSHYINDKDISWETASNEFSGFQIRF